MYKIDNNRISFYGDINFNDFEYIDEGTTATVYKIRIDNKDYALKVFKINLEEIEDQIKEKSKINIDSYISPIKMLYINNKFSGYLMKLCKGKNLYENELNITVKNFIHSTKKLIQDTEKMSKLGYELIDIYEYNIIYDKGFKIIDLDDYEKVSNSDLKGLSEENNAIINELLSSIFIKSAGISNLFFSNGYMRRLFTLTRAGVLPFEEFFYEILTIATNLSNKKIEKISEIGKVLLNTKKYRI